ncbi:hypothetical protein JOE48_005790 [Methylobacterium sp. PvR107]|nr:hypothetical protein [Methylobacterium sp. PvR107]
MQGGSGLVREDLRAAQPGVIVDGEALCFAQRLLISGWDHGERAEAWRADVPLPERGIRA